MKTSDFDYHLPAGHIAQTAAEPRDHSRLMVIHRGGGAVEHRRFHELPSLLREGDLMVCNDSRVLPARLRGSKVDTGARIELLLLRKLEPGIWETLARPGRRLKAGTRLEIAGSPPVAAEVIEKGEDGTVVVSFSDEQALEAAGAVPLPPYIRRRLDDAERYQTVYAREKGSVAAPTAGLHFTPELMDRLREKGVHITFVTLHLALDSFRPVQAEDPRQHMIHREYGRIEPGAAGEINEAKTEGRRVICVGTSVARLLEHAAGAGSGEIAPFEGWADLFIMPGYRFKAVDALVTNFHL
ncbi:MAG TPA: tRNA preQ1(34) S-adenosylmethionine ribosyltransferase-isomerase QueA, partial [Dehalococcoidia bacterium]|nr:tRNA preQ1(34) S-adenosylmethionine ribosyltransferase-isomerase QueA [Dehalococcoidia bacterium]